MFAWLIITSFQFVFFGSVKNIIYKTNIIFTKLLLNKEMDDGGNRR